MCASMNGHVYMWVWVCFACVCVDVGEKGREGGGLDRTANPGYIQLRRPYQNETQL